MSEQIKVLFYSRPRKTHRELAGDAKWLMWRNVLDTYVSRRCFVEEETLRWFRCHNIEYSIEYEYAISVEGPTTESSVSVVFNCEEHAEMFRIRFGDYFYV